MPCEAAWYYNWGNCSHRVLVICSRLSRTISLWCGYDRVGRPGFIKRSNPEKHWWATHSTSPLPYSVQHVYQNGKSSPRSSWGEKQADTLPSGGQALQQPVVPQAALLETKEKHFSNIYLFSFYKNHWFSIVGVFYRITQEASAISISSLYLPQHQILSYGSKVEVGRGAGKESWPQWETLSCVPAAMSIRLSSTSTHRQPAAATGILSEPCTDPLYGPGQFTNLPEPQSHLQKGATTPT